MDNERIPTMPQGGEERVPTMPQGERIPTMPQGERIPTMPQGEGERIPTMPQGNGGRVPTMPQGNGGRVPTMPQADSQNAGRKRRIIDHDYNFTGEKGGSFVIEASRPVSIDSGESQIFRCVRPASEEEYIAKILTSVKPSDDPAARRTRDRVIRFLDTVSLVENSHILPLIDHGQIDIDGSGYYVEIYPFCKDGDLGRKGRISYEELRRKIIPAVNEALHLFHENGLVHRDVKPDNLYRYNGQVVLGDFGITCVLGPDGLAVDRLKRGTLGYYAPELMSQAAVKASDYYSFGQTIWTLYSGEMMYRDTLRYDKELGIEALRQKINADMLQEKYEGLDEIDDKDKFLEILIRGLLQYDPNSRFDYEQVKRWLRGDKSLSNEISNYKGPKTFQNPFNINGTECWDIDDICEALLNNWNEAKKLLYRDRIESFFYNNGENIAGEIGKIKREYVRYQPDDGSRATNEQNELWNDIGLSRLLMLLDKDKTLFWRGKHFRSFNELTTYIGMLLRGDGNQPYTNRDITNLIASGLLNDWYDIQANKDGRPDENTKKVLDIAMTLAKSEEEWDWKRSYSIVYYLPIGGVVTRYKNCSSIDELAEYLIEQKADLIEEISQMLQDPRFYGFLIALGYISGKNDFPNNVDREHPENYKNINAVFDFLDEKIKEDLRDSLASLYREYGPYAHLLWWKNHLNLYNFNTVEANRIKKQIEETRLDENTISKIGEQYLKLQKLSINFRKLFVDNVFLAQMGMDQGRKDITSSQGDAYWEFDYCGQRAPIGFFQELRGHN